MTGPDSDPLALLRSRAAAMYDRDPACQSAGISLDEIGVGRAVMSMPITAAMVNGHGIAHGGYVFLLADSAFAYACNSYGPVTVAQSAQVTFLRPAAVSDRLRAEAVERVRFGRNGIYDVTVTAAGGAVVAEFRGHSVMLSAPPPEEEGDARA